MQEKYDEEQKGKRIHQMTEFPIAMRHMIELQGLEIKRVTCKCEKCGATLSGQIVGSDIGRGFFRPESPDYGGMDKSMTLHHVETNDGAGGDGEHNRFTVTGDVWGTAYVSGQGCAVIKPE